MDFTDLEEYIQSLPDKGIPGCEVIVMQDHKTLFRSCAGYSDYEKRRPTDERNLYYLYSSSKVMTAVAAMAAIEDGYLKLHTRVADVIPEYANLTVHSGDKCVRAETPLTVYHLLTMTGGYDYNLKSASILSAQKENADASTLDIVRALAGEPLQFEPGTHYQYSLCHDILAGTVEAAVNMPFSAYVKKRIAQPLGMTEIHYHMAEIGDMSRLAAQYRINEAGKCEKEEPVNPFLLTPAYESGGAGIITTASSYVLLLDALANGGVGANGARILSGESVREMGKNQLTPAQLADYYATLGNRGYSYGLGVRTLITRKSPVNGNTSLSHVGEFGWAGAGGTYMLVDPVSRLAICYMQDVLNMLNFTYQDHPHNMVRDLVYAAIEP